MSYCKITLAALVCFRHQLEAARWARTLPVTLLQEEATGLNWGRGSGQGGKGLELFKRPAGELVTATGAPSHQNCPGNTNPTNVMGLLHSKQGQRQGPFSNFFFFFPFCACGLQDPSSLTRG